MAEANIITEHMELVGADGVHIGTVDKVEGDRIKLTKKDSGEGAHNGHHHTIPTRLVANIRGNTVSLTIDAAAAAALEEEA